MTVSFTHCNESVIAKVSQVYATIVSSTLRMSYTLQAKPPSILLSHPPLQPLPQPPSSPNPLPPPPGHRLHAGVGVC